MPSNDETEKSVSNGICQYLFNGRFSMKVRRDVCFGQQTLITHRQSCRSGRSFRPFPKISFGISSGNVLVGLTSFCCGYMVQILAGVALNAMSVGWASSIANALIAEGVGDVIFAIRMAYYSRSKDTQRTKCGA